jgi:glycosyltransferase involved in cell wall biosynthesis
VGDEAVEGRRVGEPEVAGETLCLAAERVDTDEIEVQPRDRRVGGGDGAQERRLILDAVEAGDVDKTRRAGGSAGGVRREPATVGAERHDGVDTMPCLFDVGTHPFGGDGDGAGSPQHMTGDARTEAAERAAVVDVAHRHQLTTGDVDDVRDAVPLRGGDCAEAGHARPERVHDVGASLRADRSHAARDLARQPVRAACLGWDVDHGRAEQRVRACLALLAERDDGDAMLARESLDQRQQCGDHTLDATTVDAARHHEHDMHDASVARRGIHRIVTAAVQSAVVLRDDQTGLLRWVLEACGGVPDVPLPDLDLLRLRGAGVATGLTAAVGALAARHGIELAPSWRDFVAEQTHTVATRRRRYVSVLPEVLALLSDAGVGAVPVKGAVVADAVWPVADARPMSDIDLIVRPADRERARTALVAGSVVFDERTAGEDTYLLWGDGAAVDIDRESTAHSGKLEIHPGWRERIHDYEVDDGGWLLSVAEDGELAGAACRTLAPHALATHALGHLSVSAIRAEVRAVNVVDVALLLSQLVASEADAFERAIATLDPRLSAAGLWLVAAMRPSWWTAHIDLDRLVASELDRLPHAAAHLRLAAPGDVLRAPGTRTSLGWRRSFATTRRERAAVLRQAISPRVTDLRAQHPDAATWRLHAGRARRAVGRTARRLGPRPAVPGRVVYVLVGPSAGDLDADLGRNPTPARTLAALRAAGVDVVGVARGHADANLEHTGTSWFVVSDRSRAAWRVAGHVGRLRPAVVHANGTGFSLAWIALRVRCGRGVRIVVQHHGEPPGTGATRVAKRLAQRFVDGYLFTGGHEQAAAFVTGGALTSTAQVHDVLESSADLAPLDPIEARHMTGMTGSPSVVAVGRLVAGKDPLTALRGFAGFVARASDAELWWLYQDATIEHDVRAEITWLGLDERVHLVGRVERDDMSAWLSGADIVLSASRHEGSGYALIEAIRCGCTPVVSDIAPHRAIVGELGTRFAPGDADDAAAALSAAVPDRAAAHQRFDRHLGWNAVAEQLIAAYALDVTPGV